MRSARSYNKFLAALCRRTWTDEDGRTDGWTDVLTDRQTDVMCLSARAEAAA